MKIFFDCCAYSFTITTLVLNAAMWILRYVSPYVILCTIAAAGDRADRPKSYFIRDAEDRPTERKLYAQNPPEAELGPPTPRTFEAKPRKTYRADRPKSYFIHDESAKAEFDLPEFEELDDTDCDKRAEADVEVEEDDTVPAPKFEPTDEPKMHARYRPTFTTFLRQAVHVFDDLPEELGDEQPDDFQPLALDFYSPPWCQFCPQVLAKLDVDPRITFNIKKEEFPMAKPNGEPWEYPLIVDPESNTYVRQEFMRSSDTVIEGVNSSRSRRGLTLAAAPRDIVVGDVPGELVSPLLSSDEGQWKFKNRAETFTHKAFTVSIPAGLVIRGSSDKRGSRIEFTGEKPTIKVNGFWHIRRNVNSVVATKTAVTLNLNWWQTVSFEVR